MRGPGRKHRAATALLGAGLALAALAAGCSRQPAAEGPSVESCTQVGVAAINHHVTVTTLPAACRGLTRAQINFAVGSALRLAAGGAGGGAGGRERARHRVAEVSHFLERLVTTIPPQPSRPQPPTPATGQASPATLGLIALGTWLVTLALGLGMMARWVFRRRPTHAGVGRIRRPPAANAAHLVLASTSLLIWIIYLATRLTGLAWAACVLLPFVAGLGMLLVFLPPSVRPAEGPTAPARPAGTAGDPAQGGSSRTARPPVFVVAAHIAFATATILFAVLTAIGVG